MSTIKIGKYPVSTRTSWSRNSEWLAMPSVSSSEEKIVILNAVQEKSNFVAFNIAGDYTVDWGDGTVENFSSGVTAEHEYDYADTDLDGTLTSLGYKQALITITPQVGSNITSANFQVKHSTSGLQVYATGYLDIVLSGPNLTSLIFSGSTVEHRLLERVEFLNIGSVTNMTNMFYNCYSLQSVSLFNTASVTNMSSMFYNCYSLQSVPLFNTVSVTNMQNMFNGCFSLQSVPLFNTASLQFMTNMFQYCYSLQSVPLFNTASVTSMSTMFFNCYSLQSVPLFNTVSVTNMQNMFNGCNSLQSVPLFNTASVTNMSSMFYNCFSLQSVPLFNTALVETMSNMFQYCVSLQSVPLFNTVSVTNMQNMFNNCNSLQSVPLFNTASVTNMSSMFFNCYSLAKIPAFDASAVNVSFNTFASNARSLAKVEMTGIAEDISFANAKLSAAELDAIYTALPTVVGKTITVTGNYGTATHNPTIATAKGWTVTN